MSDNPIVGHKTFLNDDGSYRHEPIRKDEADRLWAKCEAEDKRRAEAMPDEQSALKAMFDAWYRLKELGWREVIYCPKDGTPFKVIEAGSTGIFDASYSGEWPDGYLNVHDGHDTYSGRPGGTILFKATMPAEFPKPRRQSTPCPECHLQLGETCDICGAVGNA